MRWVLGILLIVFLAVAANLIWLMTSTVRIHNGTDSTMNSLAYTACETKHSVGELRPGESVFRFLEACGDDTLIIHVADQEFCQTYVEGELYHVDAVIRSPQEVECEYDDLISSLFIVKVLF
jgi:hypothetical protein